VTQSTTPRPCGLELDKRRGAWRAEIAVRIQELRHRLELVAAEPAPAPPQPAPVEETVVSKTAGTRVTVQLEEVRPPPRRLDPEVRAAHVKAAEQALGDACTAIDEIDLPARLRAWWTGTHVTAGWESVHIAAAELVDLEPDEDVRAGLPRLLTWLGEVMPAGEERTRYERELRAFADGTKPLDRTVVRQAQRDTITANNEKHANLRALRNQLALVSAALAALLLTLGVWHAVNPDVVTLCGTTPADAAAKAGAAAKRCLDGSASRGFDVLEVELIGAIGGLLSIAFGLGGATTPPSRYNPRPQQALLKPVAGAATGLIGVMLVQSNIVIAPTSEASETLLLAYAAIFGFAQQLLTRFVDKRASTLLGEKEPAKRAEA
jgi:hypothetical protein